MGGRRQRLGRVENEAVCLQGGWAEPAGVPGEEQRPEGTEESGHCHAHTLLVCTVSLPLGPLLLLSFLSAASFPSSALSLCLNVETLKF